MKRIFYFLAMIAVVSAVLVSCEPEEESFDESLLIGKWKSGTLYYKYLSDHTGGTWDTGDDVTEDEAQPFTWSLEKTELTHIHILEMGGTVPKVYTVTELTSTSLSYHDSFGVNFTFSKVGK